MSVFIAVGDQTWVRRTVPLVCKGWAERGLFFLLAMFRERVSGGRGAFFVVRLAWGEERE